MNNNLKRWLPFIIGFAIAGGWMFLVFYDMDYSNAFFSKQMGGPVTDHEKMTIADWLKIFLPLGLILLFISVTAVIRNVKQKTKKFYRPRRKGGKRTFHRKMKKVAH